MRQQGLEVVAGDYQEMRPHKEQYSIMLRSLMNRLRDFSPYYRQKYAAAGISCDDIKSIDDLKILPFTGKDELRQEEALALRAVPEEEIIRIHSTSGTTGKPVIIPYTQKDVDDWAEMMKRCLQLAGLTRRDRIQVTPGYGLWTAGIGFQNGCERLGAMVIPMGPGNTEKQLAMMIDLKATALMATASYALLLGEEINRRGLRDKIQLKTAVLGSERWGEKMRMRLEELLNLESYDIYGLTEVYGPGIGIDCRYHQGMHYFSDYMYFEIIDPETGEVLPPGQVGELVVTTLVKEGMPLVRYRTRDLTCIIDEPCPCGCPFPRIGRILGRSDDTVKIKGVNVYPGQIEDVIRMSSGLSSEYQMIIEREKGKDRVLIRVEEDPKHPDKGAAAELKHNIKAIINIIADVEVVPYQTLPRSEKKTRRVFDNRHLD
ncbi:MAG: phenylacetate--CoA ligase family protein [Syntrophomonadaceae bacterium]|jgi:phenylacetate-CoA ligase